LRRRAEGVAGAALHPRWWIAVVVDVPDADVAATVAGRLRGRFFGAVDDRFNASLLPVTDEVEAVIGAIRRYVAGVPSWASPESVDS